MQLTLNIHGTLAKFYRLFYQTTILPNNLCSYFWKLVIGIICLPICYPIVIINYFTNPIKYFKEEKEYYGGYGVSSAIGGLLNLLILCIGGFSSDQIYGRGITKYMAFWKFYCNGVITVLALLLIIAIIIALIVGIYYLAEYIEDKRERKQEEISDEEWNKREAIKQELKRKKELRKQKSIWYLTKKMFISWKEKHCPIIEWKNDK